MQIDKFKDQFPMLTEPIIEQTMNIISSEIFNYNLNINPSEEVMENIENTLCRLAAISEYITIDQFTTPDQNRQLELFIRASWNNSKIINNAKVYVCILYTKFIMDLIEFLIRNENTPQDRIIFLNSEMKLFIGSLFDIIQQDFSQQNKYLIQTAFLSICKILCFVRKDWVNLLDNAAMADIEEIIDESSLFKLETFLIKYVFLQKMDTNQSESLSLEIAERKTLLNMWIKLFECNNSFTISLDLNYIFIHITTVS